VVHVLKHVSGILTVNFGLLVKCLISEGVHILFEGGVVSLLTISLCWWDGGGSIRGERGHDSDDDSGGTYGEPAVSCVCVSICYSHSTNIQNCII
jgi:hypothetical protein